MWMRILACLAASLLVVFSRSLLAQEQDFVLEMKRVQAMLSLINTELKSDLDQVLVLQEAIKANSRLPLETQGRSPDVAFYEDVAAAQRQAIQREAVITARLGAILTRSAALDEEKQRLLERFRELSQLPQVRAANLANPPR